MSRQITLKRVPCGQAASLASETTQTALCAFLFAIAELSVSYLLLVQSAKWAFYRVWPPAGIAPAPHLRSHLPLIGGS